MFDASLTLRAARAEDIKRRQEDKVPLSKLAGRNTSGILHGCFDVQVREEGGGVTGQTGGAEPSLFVSPVTPRFRYSRVGSPQ